MKRRSLSPMSWLSSSKNSRRQFILSSVAVFGSIYVSSCSGDDPDPDPKPEPEPEKDPTLAFVGDSMTISSGGSQPYGNLVSKALAGRPFIVEAMGGQTAIQIAGRQGGIPVTISVEGNAFKGTDAVRVTKISNEFLSTVATNDERTRKVSVSGVRCTMIRNGQSNPKAENYTIKPDASSNVAIPENSAVTVENAVKMKSATQILWMGRNDVGSKTMIEDVTKSLEQCVAFISEPKRFIILGVLPSVPEIKTTVEYKSIVELNGQLQAKYNTQFLPMPPPSTEEMAAVGYVPTDTDKAQIENGVFPRGMRIDSTHFTDAGYQIVANRVVAKLKELKY